jgi:hypothetical protein
MTCNVLFLHQNFPGQYKRLATEIGRREGYTAVALGQKAPFDADFGPVAYEGIDTEVACPGQTQPLSLPSGDTLAPGQILITFMAPSMEPDHGLHSFRSEMA